MLAASANTDTYLLVFGILFLVFAVFVLLYLGLCTYLVFTKMMRPKRRETEAHIDYEVREKGFDRAWLDIPYERYETESQFGYKLVGRLYRPETPSDKFIFTLHGHNTYGISMLIYMREFVAMGYNVFVPDHRYSGESGGDSLSFGYFERHDVITWLDYMEKQFPAATFALFGASMGSAIATMVTAMDKRVRFLIAYCGYANMEELIVPLVKMRWVYRFFSTGLKLAAATFFKVDLEDIRPADSMKKVTVPTLILHSKGDKLVYYNNGLMMHAANPAATFVTFETVGHVRSIVHHREEYVGALTKFVQEVDAAKNEA